MCDSLKGKVNKPGQCEGLYHADSNLVLIEYYDFDPNITKKTVLSNAFVNSEKKPPAATVPVFDEYKAAFAFLSCSTRISMSTAGRTSKEVT